MCEATKRVKITLEGVTSDPITKSILILAESMDGSLSKIEDRQEKIILLLEKQTVESNKRHEESIKRHEDNSQKLNDAIRNRRLDCAEHKKEIDARFKDVELVTEDLSYFKRHPKLLIVLGIGLSFLFGLAFGYEKVWELLKLG